MSGGVLLYVDAKSIECNEADEPFSTACKDATLSASPLHNGETGDWRKAIEQTLEGLA
jgi:hypothetical protein